MAGNSARPEVKNRGWIVTFSAMISLLMLGALYAWSVVAKAITEDPNFDPNQWGEATRSWPYSVCLIFFSLIMILGGRIQDTSGPRLVITAGGILVGAGLIVCGLSTSPIVWYIGFGALLGTGIGLAYSSGTPPSVKWFPASKTGLISGIVVSGFGVGAVWVAPFLRAMIKAYGISHTMIIFGVICMIVMVIFAQFVKAPPPDYVPVEGGSATAAKPKKVVVDWSPDEMVRRWQFSAMVACFAFGGGAGLVFIGKLASIATSFGFEKYSAIVVSVVALGNGIGRVVYGKLSDDIGRRPVLGVAFALQAVLLTVLSFWPVSSFTVNDAGNKVYDVNPSTGSLVLVMLIGAIIGANYGAVLAVVPALTKDYFGLKNFGINYGLVYQGWGIGGFIVSQIGAYLVAAQKSDGDTNIYLWAYYWVIALLIVGVGLLLALRAPKKVPAEQI
ncbi:MAG: OFA family MFS transporter [Thermoleophilia bacterium]